MMETKTKRPDVHIEPTLYEVMKAYCKRKQTPIARWIRNLIIRELREQGALTPEHIRTIRGLN